MSKIRIQDLYQMIENDNQGVGGRPQRKREDPKRKGRIQTDEDHFPTKKRDSWIGNNKRERNRH